MSGSSPLSQFLTTVSILLCFSSINIIDATCLETEKQALLSFKKDLKDPSNRLSSWIDEIDCCKWEGVACSNKSGHVFQFRLRNPGLIIFYNPLLSPRYGITCTVDPATALSGKINPSLLNLTFLSHLDLSLNDFEGIPIPRFLGSLKSLRYLNLSKAGFQGMVPHEFGNLSSLHTLSVRAMDNLGLQVDNLDWLVGLSNLEHLDMSLVDLSTATNWLKVINMIPSLVELHFYGCELYHISHLINHNFSSLTVLDISGNGFGSLMPRWIFGLTSVVYLDLRFNSFESLWPRGPWNLTSLQHLDLSWNSLNGSLPRELINLNIVSLYLRSNQFVNPFPDGIWNWTGLESLDLSKNNLNCFLPSQLLTLKDLISLDLSNNKLQGSIPRTIANISNLQYLDLSSNSLSSSLPYELFNLNGLKILDLSSNDFDDPILTHELFNLNGLKILDLSFNHFDDPILGNLGNSTKLMYLDLSNNNLHSSISKWLYNFTSLESLSLCYNQLQGEILNDIVQNGKFTSLRALNLGYNAITGSVPESLGQLSKLEALYIFNNLMEGNVTGSQLDNLTTNLRFFSASGNSLALQVGTSWIPRAQFEVLGLGSWVLGSKFPTWLRSQKRILGLNLSSTGISGTVPLWFWNLSMQLRFLDLSRNQLRGEISNIYGTLPLSRVYLNSNKFSGPLPVLVSPDVVYLNLSNNLFSGGISHFLCDVKSEEEPNLQNLLLGDNFLSGEIPDCWMKWPNLVDINLNNNNFTGSIPRSMVNLEYLDKLHLNNNSISGQVPSIL